jgi:hypothetical protein
MKTRRRALGKPALGFLGTTAFGATACAESLPARLTNPAASRSRWGAIFHGVLAAIEDALGVELRQRPRRRDRTGRSRRLRNLSTERLSYSTRPVMSLNNCR